MLIVSGMLLKAPVTGSASLASSKLSATSCLVLSIMSNGGLLESKGGRVASSGGLVRPKASGELLAAARPLALPLPTVTVAMLQESNEDTTFVYENTYSEILN